jgi:hypothetical protein
MPRAEVRLPDWPFGAASRRLLLEALLLDKQPIDGWTKAALEDRAEVGTGGLDEVLAGALQLGLVRREDGVWHRGQPLPAIARPIKQLLAKAKELPNDEITDLPTRSYRWRP